MKPSEIRRWITWVLHHADVRVGMSADVVWFALCRTVKPMPDNLTQDTIALVMREMARDRSIIAVSKGGPGSPGARYAVPNKAFRAAYRAPPTPRPPTIATDEVCVQCEGDGQWRVPGVWEVDEICVACRATGRKLLHGPLAPRHRQSPIIERWQRKKRETGLPILLDPG